MSKVNHHCSSVHEFYLAHRYKQITKINEKKTYVIDDFEAVGVLGALGVLGQLGGDTDLVTHIQKTAQKRKLR